MTKDTQNRSGRWQVLLAALMAVLCSAGRADVVELVNGDRYSGTVMSVTMTNLTLRSSVQGTITLPREKLASINFGEAAAKPAVSALKSSGPPSEGGIAALAQQLLGSGKATNRSDQIAKQLLENAGPEAKQKYNEMLKGLLSGSLTLGELRKQAQQTINEVEQAKEELGPEASDLLDGYLSILQRFVQEPAPETPSP